MKLRRAMAVAAATAVVGPLALLSAPAAFATEPSDQATSPAATVTPPASPTTPGSTVPGTPSGTPGDSSSPATTPPASTTPSGPPSVSASPGASPTEDPETPFCEDLDEDYGDAKVSADIKGLPGKIVAGSGFHSFKLIVTNESKLDIEGVSFYAEIENYELDESKYLSPYVDLEFKNPESGKWTRIGDEEWAGDLFFGVDTLKAHQSESVSLRVSIGKTAPTGDAYSFGSGAYVDNVDGQDCIAEGWAHYDFQVLKAGSQNPEPGDAEPGDGDNGPGKQPQGDASDVPTGNLAATGSSSALPMIGLVGGVAVVAGAGAVLVVRRRRNGDAAA
ncbi:LAETG motif-containing sortase-dependent surface protein [Streptomyces sp. NPDC058371]|uniref:LAETG motif-containing sortase-dependent surface protein n=1 Tax=Streptomyces sp. NPDC058371 TaxID=3346463 RepID=UPI00364D45B3